MQFRQRPRLHLLILAGAAAIVVAVFVGLAAGMGKAGFPLDDAWIHQTYARNLVRNGRWEYSGGIASSGSTSPLWTLLLAAGYLLRAPYLVWTYLLGALTLLALALAGKRVWCLLWPDKSDWDWIAGLVLVFTWPLIWAAASGMETLLYAAIGLWDVALFLQLTENNHEVETENPSPSRRSIAKTARSIAPMGIVSGLLILTRPDGVVLLFLIGVGLSMEPASLWRRLGKITICCGMAALLLLPNVLFNFLTSGNFWPNTYYAKQVEYSALLAQPLIPRLTRLLFFSMGGPESGWQGSSGAHLFLVPGLIAAAALSIKQDIARRRLRNLLPVLWAGGHVLLYAWRLPVTYHHGRYLFAAMPIWILYGLAGSHWLLIRMGDARISRLLRRVAILSFVALSLIFFLIGAQSYATDVAFIEGEMVDVARWLSQNTQAGALVATHDIGAIGYFSGRKLLDLAGLITPEIIPSLADESALSQYVLASDANYLVSAPGWTYDSVISTGRAVMLYSTGYAWTQEQGENNMTVYQLTQ